MTNDDIEIRSGGAVSVDTDSLRHAAGMCTQLAADCADAAGWICRAADAAWTEGLPLPFPVVPVADAEHGAERIAQALRRRAEVYDAVEHAAARQLDASEKGGTAVSGGAPADIHAEAVRELQVWREGIHHEVERQLAGALTPVSAVLLLFGATIAAPVSLLPVALTWTVRELGLGLVPRDAPPLVGVAPPVTVTELTRTRATAPSTLAEIAERMPGEGDSRVRVESYPAAGGGREFIVYIAGTQSLGGDDPWDMSSNLDLYSRRISASYAAVEKALTAAGAVHGDVVNIAGYSQGAMIGAHAARSGEYDVGWFVTFGSPVQAILPDDVVQVTVRHADDPVVALAAGGAPTVAGSDGSVIVERVADPLPRFDDLRAGVHQLGQYRETAMRADESDDPRIRAFHAGLQSMAGGAAGTAIVYGARRIVPAPVTGGRARRSVSGASSAGGGG